MVYKAFDDMTHEVVAVKELIDQADLPRREVAIARQVTHINVCRIFDYFERGDGTRCIAMEFVDGGNLRTLMERSGPLPVEKWLSIVRQILNGLEAAHLKNIVHRDLKPENILITSDGTVKLSDFGHARVIGTKPSMESEWELGTRAYMAPEQAVGRECDARTDIYSIGIILYEMLSRKRPTSPTISLPLPSGVPAQIETVIRRCLEIDPANRFSSISELRNALAERSPMPPVRKLTGSLLASLTVVVLLSIPLWNHFWVDSSRPAIRGQTANFSDFRNSISAPGLPVTPAGIAETVSTERADVRSGGAGRSLAAFEAFSSGLYFLRDDLAADALSKFDLTLAIDPHYPGAHHYRGVALAKLGRWDEAIEAFKSALPRSEPERPVLWSWDAPFASVPSGADPPRHGMIRAVDIIQRHLQRDLFRGRKTVPLQKQIVYGEHAGKATVLHFLDLERHSARRVEIPDENIRLDTTAYANGSFTVLASEGGNPGELPQRIRYYAFAADSSRLWQMDLTEYGKDLPRTVLIGDALYIHLPGLQRVDLVDARTGSLLWRRQGLLIDAYEPPELRHTKAYGDILIARSPDSYRAIRMSDGTDAWTVPVQSPKASDLTDDEMLIVFEPERRIFTIDLETGKTIAEVKIEQHVDAFQTSLGPRWIVGAVLEGNTLYVLSPDMHLYATSPFGRGRRATGAPGEGVRSRQILQPSPDAPSIIGSPSPSEGEVLWRTPIQKKIQSIRVHGNKVYLGTETGELIVVNAATGEIMRTTKLADQLVLVEYAGDDAVLMKSANTLYGLGTSGEKTWEYSPIDPTGEMTYLNGVITVYTSPLQMSALDVASGKLLWQYADGSRLYPFATAGRFFIVGENGVKEYSVVAKRKRARSASAVARSLEGSAQPQEKPADALTDKETLTELARTYVAKGDLEQARVFLEKAAAIDANYPPLILVRAQLLKARGHADGVRREQARYASLVGLESKEAQPAISDMKRDHRLLWQTAIGPDVAGDPVIIENRLVSIGRRFGIESAIIALDLQSGAAIWRYTAERFVASVVGNQEPVPFLWYVSGMDADATALTLYRIDIRTGERKQLANWHRPNRVDETWIAYGSGRIFVATVSRDLSMSTLQVGIDCFDAGSGARSWQKTHNFKANALSLRRPIDMFTPQKDSLIYSIGQERWTVRASDGSSLPPVAPAATGHSWELRGDNLGVEIDRSTGKVVAKHAILWRPSGFRLQSGRLYAFTADGHAYAME